MHGILYTELRKYVLIKHGLGAWKTLVSNAGLIEKPYMPFETYPDEELVALVTAAGDLTERTVSSVLEDFGIFIAAELLAMYQPLIQPHWRTLDVLEHTEATIHTVVRKKNRGALPPELICHRPSADEVVITYSSHRKLCHVAKGITKGLAELYKEKVVINESSCMLHGDAACVISVKLVR